MPFVLRGGRLLLIAPLVFAQVQPESVGVLGATLAIEGCRSLNQEEHLPGAVVVVGRSVRSSGARIWQSRA